MGLQCTNFKQYLRHIVMLCHELLQLPSNHVHGLGAEVNLWEFVPEVLRHT